MDSRIVTLDSNLILETIEQQRKKLGMTRVEVAYQAGVNYPTFNGNFAKGRIPKLNDLYRISCAIGLPIDSLIKGDADIKNKHNILFWEQFAYDNKFPESCLIMQSKDKVGIARFLERLSTNLDLAYLSKDKDIWKFDRENLTEFLYIYKFLTLDEVDVMDGFLKSYDFNLNRIECVDAFDSLYNSFLYRKNIEFREFLNGNEFFLNNTVQNLWKEIDERVSNRYKNKSDFYFESGISNQSYAKYLKGESNSSPATETAFRACNILDIRNLDDAIREHIEQAKEMTICGYHTPCGTPYSIYIDDSKKKEQKLTFKLIPTDNPVHELKTLPILQYYIEKMFSLYGNEWVRMVSVIYSLWGKHSYSQFSYRHSKEQRELSAKQQLSGKKTEK